MKRLIALFLLACCLPLTAHADDASKRAKLDELFGLMHMDAVMQTMMDNMQKQMGAMTQQFSGKDMPPDELARVTDMQKQMFSLIEAQLSWKSVEPAYVEIYEKNFTEAQIDDLLTFYKSPTGAVMLQKMPELATEGMQIAQERMQAIQPQIRALMDDFVKKAAADAAAKKETSNKP